MPITHLETSPVIDLSDWNAGHVDAAGTSFPGSPATSERFFRTDRGLEYYYDGTRWLTTTLFYANGGANETLIPFTANAEFARNYPAFNPTYQSYIVDWLITWAVSVNANGSNFWQLTLRESSADTSTTNLATTDTSTGVTYTFQRNIISVNTLLPTTTFEIHTHAQKTGAGGDLYVAAAYTFRIVG